MRAATHHLQPGVCSPRGSGAAKPLFLATPATRPDLVLGCEVAIMGCKLAEGKLKGQLT